MRYVFRVDGPPHGDSTYAECFGPNGRPIERSSHSTLEAAFLALCDAGYEGDNYNADIHDRISGDTYNFKAARAKLRGG